MSKRPLKVIGDLEFIPLSFAVTRNGKAEPVSSSEHQIIVLLQAGPATMEECLKASGLTTMPSLKMTVARLRAKLKPMGVTIVSANVLRGHYALARSRS